MNADTWPMPLTGDAPVRIAPRPRLARRLRVPLRAPAAAQGGDHFATIAVLALSATLLAFLAALERGGYASLASLELWGRTLLAVDGAVRAPSVIAAFPPLPYLAAISAELVLPSAGARLLGAITIVFFALMVAGWLRAFRSEGFGRGFAMLAVALLALNPVMLRSLAEGPGWASLHAGLSMLAIGLFNLRRDHRINDVILVALSLPVILLSDPAGFVIVFAAIPAIVLCVPDAQMRRSPVGVLMTLLFPAAFILFGFAYTNWIFNGDAWAFLGGFTALAVAPPVPFSGFELAMAGLAASAPILFAILLRSRWQSGLRRATCAVLLCAVVAALLGWATKVWPSAAQFASLGIPLAMAAATRWPRNRPGDERGIALLLLAGWLGGLVFAWNAPDSESERMRAGLTGAPMAAADAEMAALGYALSGYDDVMFDAEEAPAAIAYRGDAQGISAASTMRFRIAGLRQFADARVQVVRDTRSPTGADAMGRTFPRLHEHGLPGYRLLHDGPDWRAWIREEGR